MSRILTGEEKVLIKQLKKLGLHYQARYIEMFGEENLNPWFIRGGNEATESFYKMCVEEKHPWDFYVDPPEEDDIL